MICRTEPWSECLIAYWSAIYRFRLMERSWTLTFAGPAWVVNNAMAHDLPQCWGIITACNPGSRVHDTAENERRALELMAALDESGLAHSAAVNSDRDGSWPEPGRLVWGVERTVVLNLARRFGQRAVVWSAGGRGAP